MPRPRNVVPSRILHLALREDLLTRVDLLLISDSSGKVPYGAYQELFTGLLRQLFEEKDLDLGPFLDALPGQHIVRGRVGTLDALLTHLKRATAPTGIL